MSREIEDCLSSLDRKLFWMGGKDRKDVMREFRSHLEERARSGEDPKNILASFGSIDEVSKDYKRIYGFGGLFLGLLVAAGAFIAVLSVPAIYLQTPDVSSVTWVSLGFLAAGIVMIIASSVVGGGKAGIAIGSAECIARFVVIAVYVVGDNIATDDGIIDSVGFVLTSALLPIIGYLSSLWKKTDEPADI